MKWLPTFALATLALTACAREGGELREATERRRLATRDADTASAPDTGGDYRLPAFVDSSPKPSGPAAAPAAPPPADTAPAAPSAGWSTESWEEEVPGNDVHTLRGMRVGLNAGFDRLVLDFGTDPVPGYRVEYAKSPPRQCGSGDPVPVAGQRWIVVRLRDSQAHDDAGRPTIAQRQIVPTTPVIREAEIICDFEGDVEIAVGVRIANPFRVLVVPTPNRLIVDVKQ